MIAPLFIIGKAFTSLPRSRFQTLTTRWLLHLFVVDVGDVVAAALVGATALLAGVAAHVVGVEAGTGVGSAGLLLGIVHVLAGSLPSLVHLLHSGVNLGDVAGAVGSLQLGEGTLDGALLLGGNLVTIFLQVLLALDQPSCA